MEEDSKTERAVAEQVVGGGGGGGGESSPIVDRTAVSGFGVIWPNVKPFLNGGLALVLSTAELNLAKMGILCSMVLRIRCVHGQAADTFCKNQFYAVANSLKPRPFWLMLEASCSAARFGSFEILTKKVREASEGRPLTLFQEAGCGLTCGLVEFFVMHPAGAYGTSITATNEAMEKLTGKTVLQGLCRIAREKGILALWKIGPHLHHHVKLSMVRNMGMLASYNPTAEYLKESVGLSEFTAKLGASAVSAFCTGAFPALYWRIAGVPFRKQGSFIRNYAHRSPGIMLLWLSLEGLRSIEKAKGW